MLKLNQNSAAMQRIRPGDVVWAFTRWPPKKRSRQYVMVARFVVSEVGENGDTDAGKKRGRWFFKSESPHVRWFDSDGQEPADAIIRSLPIATRAIYLGQSFRGANGVRHISADLSEIDKRLKHHTRIV